MASNWPTAKLGDVIDLFDSQRVPLNSRQREERQGRFPYYGAQGIIDHIDDYIFDGRYILVAEDGENLNSKKLPLALFATGKFWVNNHAHILRGKPNIADDTFLLACLNNSDIKPFVTGAAQPKLSQGNMRLIEIPLPPVPVQQRIAGILSAYDELIENSQRRIKILETMARALYREWFVNFRFLGHENHPRVASSLGDIPQGWEVKKLGDLIINNRRSTKPGTDLDERRYVPIDCLPPKSLALLEARPIEEAQSSLQLFEKGDILFGAMRPYFHKVAIAPFAGVTRTTCFVFKPAQPEWHAFGTMTAFDEETVAYANAHSQGATIPYAVWDGSLSEMPIVLPSPEVLERFEALVAPMLSQLAQSFFVLGNLRRTRDLLLPRLLSGQIALKDN
ncbi:MAG: restriction endonuclease subunit S [Methylotenera sp.]